MKNIFIKVLSSACLTILIFFTTAVELHNGAFAEELAYPYTQTFVISAYYSPLPCQNKYVTGSYEGDIRLNGHGVHGADGTDVYPGMVAAPKTYVFGTKLYIPNIGIVAVHDRGGAIVAAGERGQNYDRLDIWMGYGDEGLKRALGWGKKTVEVTVYGITDAVVEDIEISGYSSDESIPNQCDVDENSSDDSLLTEETTYSNNYVSSSDVTEYDAKLASEISPQFKKNLDSYLTSGLEFGDEGPQVLRLQEELQNMNFYKTEKTGVYDELTVHAVYKFQQSQGIVDDETDTGAGYFGPKTRAAMNEIIGSRNYTLALIAQTSSGDTYVGVQ